MMADLDYSGTARPLERAVRDALVNCASHQPSRVATESTQNQAGLPMYHGYRVEIPTGWRALQPVFYQVPDGLPEPARPSISAAFSKGFQQFRVGVLLCRQGTDELAALQEFEAGLAGAEAFLGQDGLYLQSAQTRPAYAVLPLAAPSLARSDQAVRSECLVLLPLVHLSFWKLESLPPMMMFVDGVCLFKEAA
jgi:hypothetical protein